MRLVPDGVAPVVLVAIGLCIGAAMIAARVEGGHEAGIYPSYYPQEIQIARIEPAGALDQLTRADIHAYIGSAPAGAGAESDVLGIAESLEAFVVVTANPRLLDTSEQESRCALIDRAVRTVPRSGFVFHPYPVTRYHADYFQHFDRVARTAQRYPAGAPATPGKDSIQELRVRTNGAAVEPPRDPSLYPSLGLRAVTAESEWDISVDEITAADLLAGHRHELNGWSGSPWIKAGWFQSYLLLAATLEDLGTKEAARDMLGRLQDAGHDRTEERVQLERDL